MATTADRLEQTFVDALEIRGAVDRAALQYNKYPGWNSLGHMMLVAAIEKEFDCMLETDEILGMSDFNAALTIASKYAGS